MTFWGQWDQSQVERVTAAAELSDDELERVAEHALNTWGSEGLAHPPQTATGES